MTSSKKRASERSVWQKKSWSQGSKLVPTLPACFSGRRGSRIGVGSKSSANDIYHSKMTLELGHMRCSHRSTAAMLSLTCSHWLMAHSSILCVSSFSEKTVPSSAAVYPVILVPCECCGTTGARGTPGQISYITYSVPEFRGTDKELASVPVIPPLDVHSSEGMFNRLTTVERDCLVVL